MVRDYDALIGFLAERRTMPFTWGRKNNDCVSFATGAVRAQTGRNVLAGGPDWTTMRGAIRVLKRLGGLAEAVTANLREIPPAHAHRGDIAGVADPDMPGGIRLMLVEGEHLIGPGLAGTERQRRSMMVRAWSID